MKPLLLLATIATVNFPTLFSQPVTAQPRSTVLTTEIILADARLTREQLIERAESKRNAGNAQEAIKDYTLAIKMKPALKRSKLADIYIDRAWVYGMMNEDKLAMADYAQAIKLAPNDAKTYKARGFFSSNISPEKAIADYRKALKLSPKDPEPYSRIAYIRVAQGKHGEAVKAFSQYLKMANANSISQKDYADRGLSYHAIGDYQNAIADFNQSVKLEPLYASGYYYRGLSYQALGQKQQALGNYKQALELSNKLRPEFKNDSEVTAIMQKIKELE